MFHKPAWVWLKSGQSHEERDEFLCHSEMAGFLPAPLSDHTMVTSSPALNFLPPGMRSPSTHETPVFNSHMMLLLSFANAERLEGERSASVLAKPTWMAPALSSSTLKQHTPSLMMQLP